jgi:hypothetical protein
MKFEPLSISPNGSNRPKFPTEDDWNKWRVVVTNLERCVSLSDHVIYFIFCLIYSCHFYFNWTMYVFGEWVSSKWNRCPLTYSTSLTCGPRTHMSMTPGQRISLPLKYSKGVLLSYYSLANFYVVQCTAISSSKLEDETQLIFKRGKDKSKEKLLVLFNNLTYRSASQRQAINYSNCISHLTLKQYLTKSLSTSHV